MVTVYLLGALVLLLATYFNEIFTYIRRCYFAYYLPGPDAKFLLGHCLTLTGGHMLNIIANAWNDWGPMGRLWISVVPVVYIFNPEDLQSVLGSKKHTEKFFMYKYIQNILGKGLLTSDKESWTLHRKLIQPAFTNAVLDNFLPNFENSARRMVKYFEKDLGQTINVTKIVNQCVLDVLYSTVLGIDVDDPSRNIKESPYRQGKLTFMDRIRKPWLLLDTVYKRTSDGKAEKSLKGMLEEYTRGAMEERRSMANNNEIEPTCILDHLLKINVDNPEEFSEKDVLDEACTIMLAGQDSVAGTICFALHYLAANPDWQQKCYEEVLEMDNTDAELKHKLPIMKYLEWCIKETLRIQPVVTAFGRTAVEDITCQGKKLIAGTQIAIAPYGTHRIPTIYPEPEKFDPERFTPENAEERHRFAYIPFSAGPRNCIGHHFAMLELKVMLMTVLRRYKLHIPPDAKPLKPVFRITVRAQGGIWLQFEKRQPVEA